MKIFVVICVSAFDFHKFNSDSPIVCVCSSYDRAQKIADGLNDKDRYNWYEVDENEVDSYGN